MRNQIFQGDCRAVLKTFPDASVDSVATDPPAGVAFMLAAWDTPETYDTAEDSDFRARDAFISMLKDVFRECYRVLKPGGHMVVWSLPRTSHWTATAIEESGFEMRDCLGNAVDRSPMVEAFLQSLSEEQLELLARASPTDTWMLHVFGTGFPKSLNVGKAIDAMLTLGRSDSVGLRARDGRAVGVCKTNMLSHRSGKNDNTEGKAANPLETSASKQFQGFGTALKPAVEAWWICRKPIEESSIAAQVLKTGTGAINIDGCRVQHANPADFQKHKEQVDRIKEKGGQWGDSWKNSSDLSGASEVSTAGRWPANFALMHSPECRQVGTKTGTAFEAKAVSEPGYQRGWGRRDASFGYASEDGTETVQAYDCVLGCPVRALDEQSGILTSGKVGPEHMKNSSQQPSGGGFRGFGDVPLWGYSDSGGASRFFKTFEVKDEMPFFYTGKASKKDKNAGLDEAGVKNDHPTVKSQSLCTYLVRLVTPPGGLVLDPFMGSGSTMVAAIAEGMDYLGIEREEKFFRIAEQRIKAAEEKHRSEQAQRNLFELMMDLGDDEDE